MPSTMGTLRAVESEQPRRKRKSEITPPRMPPAKPKSAGTEAAKPALRMDMPRACTRYTGNQVIKKYVMALMQYWAM